MKNESVSLTRPHARRWQLALAVLAFSTAALAGCDRRDGTTTSTPSSSMPASAASR